MKFPDFLSGRHAGLLAVLVVAALALGCGSGSGHKRSPPVGPNITGRWNGEYFRTDRSSRTALTATIRQDGDAIWINTSKAEGRARSFTGTMDEDGEMSLTDAYDGQHWTSEYGPATTNRVVIGDYVERPSMEDPDPASYVLSLQR